MLIGSNSQLNKVFASGRQLLLITKNQKARRLKHGLTRNCQKLVNKYHCLNRNKLNKNLRWKMSIKVLHQRKKMMSSLSVKSFKNLKKITRSKHSRLNHLNLDPKQLLIEFQITGQEELTTQNRVSLRFLELLPKLKFQLHLHQVL